MNRVFIIIFFVFPLISQAQNAKDIVRKADEKLRGSSQMAEMKMTIVRPKWTREIAIKSWSKGEDYALMYITAPARDKGVVFLKRQKEIWNWQPTIDRMIKLPPSMMTQSWMGSDFKNDDLVRQSSVIDDFEHKLLGTEVIDGRDCYRIEMVPHESAAVIWGKVISWIDKKDYLQLKTEFYDEENILVNTMYGKNVKTIGNKLLPAIMEVIPADQPQQKTIIEYVSLQFDIPLTDQFFTVQNAKSIKP